MALIGPNSPRHLISLHVVFASLNVLDPDNPDLLNDVYLGLTEHSHQNTKDRQFQQ